MIYIDSVRSYPQLGQCFSLRGKVLFVRGALLRENSGFEKSGFPGAGQRSLYIPKAVRSFSTLARLTVSSVRAWSRSRKWTCPRIHPPTWSMNLRFTIVER